MGKNGGKRENWFDQQQKKFNTPDFLERIRSEDIKRGVVRILKDIAYGNIDMNTDAMYFNDRNFAENLLAGIIVLTRKYSYYRLGMDAFYSTNFHRMSEEAFSGWDTVRNNAYACYVMFNSAAYNLSCYINTSNIGFLYKMQNELGTSKRLFDTL